jgi:SPP1 family predicted phage head-tail adaptor
MQQPLSSRLSNYIDVYGSTKFENELGETDYRFDKIKSVWAEITPQNGSLVNMAGNVTYADITHKIVVRNGAIPNLANDMYFMLKGQRYDIKYFNPNYKYRDSIEIICELIIGG